MNQIKFVIPFLLSPLCSEEKTGVEWLAPMLHTRDGVFDKGLGSER